MRRLVTWPACRVVRPSIVAVALQSLLTHGAPAAFQGAFWWASGITIAALMPAIALPANKPAKAH